MNMPGKTHVYQANQINNYINNLTFYGINYQHSYP